MATYKDILKENENQNWLKGSLALGITKAGLRNLVEGDSFRVQQKIYSSIIHARNLAPGTSCSLCFTENLMLCPTRGLCSNPRNCKYHDSALKMFRPCPSQICDYFRDEICAVHRYCRPSWKNTKADQWCTNHWQVAKCFMSPDGYQDVSSFDETDFNGIMSFMINCTEIQRSLSFNIANQPNQPNILAKAWHIGRSILHSPDLKVTDTDLADYFATLNALLTDPKYLAYDSNAQQAVIKLKQLEKDTLSITSEDVCELPEEAPAMIEAGKHERSQSVDTGKPSIQVVLSKENKAIATKKLESKKKIWDSKTCFGTAERFLKETLSDELEGPGFTRITAVASGKRNLGKTLSVSEGKIFTGERDEKETFSEGKLTSETRKRQIEEPVEELQKMFSSLSCAERNKDHEWNVAIRMEDKEVMKELINDMNPPSLYETFRSAISILHNEQKYIRRLCRLVSEYILTLFDRTKIIKVYAATTTNKPDITFIVVSRYPVPVPTNNGYPLYIKDISNAVLEDNAVDDELLQMSASEKEGLKLVKHELKRNLVSLKSAVKDVSRDYFGCPNISQITFSTVKARNFSYNERKNYTVEYNPTLCIVIYVYHKGLIPVGWERFPATVGEYPIDVREFYELEIQMNSSLHCRTVTCFVYEIRQITTQGLVKRECDSTKYGLTCAHTVVAFESRGYKSGMALDEDEEYIALDRKDLKQKIPDKNVRIERLAYGKFKAEGQDPTFVDVALISIDPRSEMLQSFKEHIMKAFKDEHAPEFYYSEKEDAVYAGQVVLKFGTSSKLTFGTIADNSIIDPGYIHVLGATSMTDGRKTRQPFSIKGDSGALVFKVNHTLLNAEVLDTLDFDEEFQYDSRKLLPIGIVYGSPKGQKGATYCTQITPSLRALGEDYKFVF